MASENFLIAVEGVGARKFDGVVNKVGGTPNEGVDVAIISFL